MEVEVEVLMACLFRIPRRFWTLAIKSQTEALFFWKVQILVVQKLKQTKPKYECHDTYVNGLLKSDPWLRGSVASFYSFSFPKQFRL